MTYEDVLNRIHLHGKTMSITEAFLIIDACEKMMAYINLFEAWLDKEPKKIRIVSWIRWKKRKPKREW